MIVDKDEFQNGSSSAQVRPDAIEALSDLMEADPYIRKRLCGTVSLAFDESQSCAAPARQKQLKQNNETAKDCLELRDIRKWNSVAVQFDEQGHVKLLDLSGHRIKYLPFEPFSTFKMLQTLNLGGTDVPIAQMVEAIGNCSESLENLHLGGNGLRDVGLVTLVEQVLSSRAPNLKKLDLRYNDIGPVGLSALSKVMADAESKCRLELLYMEGNNTGDKGAEHLAASLQNDNCRLKELFLGNNKIGTDGAKALASAIESNMHLAKLYLEGNFIGEEGGSAFSNSLEKLNGNACLKKLFVDNSGIGKEESMRLARALNSDSIIGGVC